MDELKKKIKKDDFNRVFKLYPAHPWLFDKERNLIDLIEMCENAEHKDLLVDLLSEFKYPNLEDYNLFLNQISDYIVNKSGFIEESTQVASITIQDETDSSQKILYDLNIPLFKMGWTNVKTVNRFGNIVRNHKKYGKTQIVLVDEFIGSGKTVLGRIKNIKEYIKEDFELKLCFVVGMDYGIKIIESLGYEVFCPLRLPKGISERYEESIVLSATAHMKELESKLAQQINSFNLSDYSLGYNDAQALYSLESCLGNTPNSVFPVFWWPRYSNDKPRDTLLTRVEKGLK